MLHRFYFLSIFAGRFQNRACGSKSFHFYARCNQEGSGKSSGVFFNRFLPGEVQSGISVLTADGRYFSGIVGKFSEINLL